MRAACGPAGSDGQPLQPPIETTASALTSMRGTNVVRALRLLRLCRSGRNTGLTRRLLLLRLLRLLRLDVIVAARCDVFTHLAAHRAYICDQLPDLIFRNSIAICRHAV